MELSMNELRTLIAGNESRLPDDGGFTVGKNVFIRTVTHYYIGLVKEVRDTYVVLAGASWIADTGRYHDMLRDGTIAEVEPYINDVVVSRGAIVDHTRWNHDLPETQK